jgi:hypothetical protein
VSTLTERMRPSQSLVIRRCAPPRRCSTCVRREFLKNLALDCLGFVGLIAISMLALLAVYALMGKP